MDTSASEQSKAKIAISGYRIDSRGIHDRFLRWRHFGFWKYAERAKLESSQKNITLTFRFSGRKSPLKIQFGNTFSNALKLVGILEHAILHSPSLAIDPATEAFLEEAGEYLGLKDRDSPEQKEKLRLAKAKLHLRLGDSQAARKETKKLISNVGAHEAEARVIRLHSYLLEGDETMARVEYGEISKRFPENKEAKTLWAVWLLARNADNAEEFAKETIREADTLEQRLDVESQLVNFLARQRRYDEALEILEQHLSATGELEPDQRRSIEEAKAEILRLKSDKAYNRRMTVWRPLKAKVLGYGILALVALFFLSPAVRETPKLIADWKTLDQLEASGVIASSSRFSPNARDLDFGFVELSYVFRLQEEDTPTPGRFLVHDHHGRTVLRRAAADKVLSDTSSHSILYLPNSPFTCTIYPITNEHYIGVIAKHAPAYLLTIVILLVILYYALKGLYKKIKYGGSVAS